MENIEKNNINTIKFMQFMFKPTYACNLACHYCHIYHKRDKNPPIISYDMATQAFNWILKYCIEKNINRIDILWHGGEPLLVTPEHMLKIINYYMHIFNDNGIICSNSIQSNLVLLNEKYLSIIKKYFNNTIGFSYDYKSSDRCFSNGINASDIIWDKAIWAKKHGVNIGAITQLHQGNINDITELYNHFKNSGISFKFSRIRSTDNYDATISDENYINAIKKLFDIWINDESQQIKISNFYEYIQMLTTAKSSSCCFQNDCNILSFTNDGKIYFCDRTFNNGIIGDYTNDSVNNVCHNIYTNIKYHYKTSPIDCTNCKYNFLCNGGCLFNRMTDYHQHECLVTKSILSYIENYLLNSGYETVTNQHTTKI